MPVLKNIYGGQTSNSWSREGSLRGGRRQTDRGDPDFLWNSRGHNGSGVDDVPEDGSHDQMDSNEMEVMILQ